MHNSRDYQILRKYVNYLTRLKIEKLGDDYVNVNSRDKRKREKGKEKNNFLIRTA